ncbi:DUF4386 domain-containing protein [Saccharophagus degradans]|uniref:DUF4386 domain-containing protein n=1 Tax=Saccharophagus degradans TaxID=86304 RepID=A0AAW7X4W8_9GAMM|nr:DUF4386 domain-containing protein [Saccharophagus degradans]MDO6422454.1 DUF4386 domain-containing protein [Saccharophagus degradans]MDO6606935.1 DUF4386 domain-containing protein [Saccharophagus degradans]
MTKTLNARTLSLVAGGSYWVIFLAAIFANFFVLEALIADPLSTVHQHHGLVRAGILAFLITVVFDVIVAWSLNELFKEHPLSALSTLFRMMHAAIMGVAIFALPGILTLASGEEILQQVSIFNTIWLLGLFFFGIHIVLLGIIVSRIRFIDLLLMAAGAMYMLDTVAHFLLPDYTEYASIFLAFVAIPSILGEMSFAIWLLMKGGK